MNKPPLTLTLNGPMGGDEVSILWQQGDAAPIEVYFRSPDARLYPSGDAVLCLGLPPALEVDAPLRVGPPVSAAMEAQAGAVASLLRKWYPGLAHLDLKADLSSQAPATGSGRALFYSAGVDSSYSLATSASDLTHLVTLIGADIPVSERPRAGRLIAATRSVASAFGLESIIVETNIRVVSDRLIGWVEYHGAVLAAVAHMLRGELGHFRIASSADEASRLRPWGTHPDLDGLWGTDGLILEHHELVPRFSKIAGIVDFPELMRHLRVCDYDDSNCGTCPDCIFMLNALSVLKAFGKAPTFREEDRAVGRVIADGRGTRTDLLDMRAAAVRTGGPEDLPRAIDEALRGFERLERLDALTGWSARARAFKRWKRRRRYRKASASDLENLRP